MTDAPGVVIGSPPGSAQTPKSTQRPRPGLVCLLICAAAAAPIAIYLWVALHRIGYPYELDWMEGGSVELAARVASGHSLYAPPSLAFVGWTYPPLYYWVTAAVAKLIGVGFLSLRLVSLIASLVSMATMAWIVVRESGDRVAGLLAAGLFAATYRISGAWFDTGRVDSLFLALTLLTLAWGRGARGLRGGIGLGLLAFLACLTKQSALLALGPALIYVAVSRPRAGVPALLTLLALLLGSTAVLDASSDGWYRYYVVRELAQQAWAHQLLTGFWVDDILLRQWPLVILVIAGAVAPAGRAAARRAGLHAAARHTTALHAAVRHAMPRLEPRSRTALRGAADSAPGPPSVYQIATAVGLISSAWVSRLHTGGYANVLMPAYAAIALLAGMAYAGLSRNHQGRIARPLLVATLFGQLALLIYPISGQIPTAADRAAGEQLIARLRALPGPVVVLRHPWYATQAGKGTFAQEEAIGDVLRSGAIPGARRLRASLDDALNADGVQAVVLDGAFDARLLGPELTRDFRLARRPIATSRLYPLTDVRTAPTLLYLRVARAGIPQAVPGGGRRDPPSGSARAGAAVFRVGRGQAGY